MSERSSARRDARRVSVGEAAALLGISKDSVQHGGKTAYRELIEELRDRVRSLEEANRENRRISAALTSRIPELEAPTREESPETRSWWRRMFGG